MGGEEGGLFRSGLFTATSDQFTTLNVYGRIVWAMDRQTINGNTRNDAQMELHTYGISNLIDTEYFVFTEPYI